MGIAKGRNKEKFKFLKQVCVCVCKHICIYPQHLPQILENNSSFLKIGQIELN